MRPGRGCGRAGDFMPVAREGFDYVVAMDCFIHYPLRETLDALRGMEGAVSKGVLLTVAPWTPLLGLMHGVGRLFPRRNRAPGIVPVRESALRAGLSGPLGPTTLSLRQSHIVHRGFYISHGLELLRKGG